MEISVHDSGSISGSATFIHKKKDLLLAHQSFVLFCFVITYPNCCCCINLLFCSVLYYLSNLLLVQSISIFGRIQ
jgi:hypothetical protein